MPRLLEAEGLVLDRRPAGERHLRLSMLTPRLGLISVMLRETRPNASTGTRARPTDRVMQRPDLFDLAAAQLEAPENPGVPGAVYFIREYKVTRRHAGLAKRYAALEAASALAALVSANAGHFENCAPLYDLCRKALAALEDGAPPEVVRLKALFLLARAEGYAAREQWLPSLAEADRTLALAVLNKPAAEAAAVAVADASRLPKLRRVFERWLADHTDLEIRPR